jgi:transaldolase/glucose-6-phosphate isomerase
MTTSMTKNPLLGLQRLGQSVWLDYIRRSLITSGELRRLIDEDGLHGITSNPSIFEKAITGSTDYADVLETLGARGEDPERVYEQIAVRDVQDAADVLAGVYEQSRRRDGYVSLEVSPLLAHDADGTLQEARRLWSAVARPNVMIKVPGTAEGIRALRTLISDGVNINVTLLFSQAAYREVAEAYIAGLEDRAARGDAGHDISGIASVASFFVSRIDAAVEAATAGNVAARDVQGKVAIANAKLAYRHYRDVIGGARWSALAAKGAQTQRLLWASTSSKNPSYRDVLYVEELIGEDTVNTIPPATLNAFRDHGLVRPSLTEDVDGAADTMRALARAGVSIDAITDRLLDEGIDQFADAFDRLLKATGSRLSGRRTAKVDRQAFTLPRDVAAAVNASLVEWQADNKVQRLWRLDASLWTSADENRWLGWLGIADDQLAHVESLKQVAADVKAAGFTHALLLGMGGSSLCPEVLRLTFGTVTGYPELHVLDSTDPAQVRSVEARVDLERTLFIVSSKSGGTLEPNIFKQYFYERVKALVGEREVGRRFVAITDPGSHMQRVAERDGFRQIFFGVPTIGGRYSALSAFGMVPAAITGLDVARFLHATEEMVHACGPTVPAADNPGVVLGTILGVLAQRGRNKVTLIASPGIGDLGAWLEQLIAESTGKIGKGLIPIDGEPLGAPAVYGDDRVFVYLRLESAPEAAQDMAVDALERAGQPVVRIAVEEPYNLGEEFFRWEIATAVAGSIIGINPFDQPDVEASKIATRRLTDEYERTGMLPPEQPLLQADGIALFADDRNAAALKEGAGGDLSLAGYIAAHLNRLSEGDYFALLAYVEMNGSHASSLHAMRALVRDARRVATCVGFGPRFLHSTGQAYKGGPNSGVFLQVTCDDAVDLKVPGQTYTFGVVKAAQARGDFEVLAERGRRALRVHCGADVASGLRQLDHAIRQAVASPRTFSL